jgi:shikimate kinase
MPESGEELRLFPALRILGRVTAIADKTIWLVGMMGAGKSTVGRSLARRLSLPFIDTDREIERRAGSSVSEIFAREGEASFRQREANVIRELSEKAQVVALGGGAPTQPGMVELLQEHGTMVYLRAGLDTLLERIGDARTRPLLRDLTPEQRVERLRTLQREREPSYSRATVSVDAEGGSTASIVDEIVEQLNGLS